MDVEGLISTFRSEIVDQVTPYLWTDDDVYGYADDAQKMFCREAVGISDSSSDLTVVAYSAGDEFATYDPRILRIRMARRGSDYADITVRNFEDYLNGAGAVSDYGITLTPKIDMRTGPVVSIITNMEQNKIRLMYIPEVDDTVLLTVYRMPLTTITTGYTGALEVDEQHHRHLIPWMKHLAYRKEDAETFDRMKSKENEEIFLAYCDNVKREVARREHKVRTVMYGGL